jgi:ubiquinone/menaquinone biosynthesis C-methylase UbiE
VELTALDMDPAVIKSLAPLREQYGRRFKMQHADAVQLPFNRDQFDIVITVHAMHHVENVATVVQELLRVVRPGGMIGIADEDQRYVIGPLKWLWRPATALSKAKIRELVAAESDILVEEGGRHYFMWARKPYPQKLGAAAKL